jgi:Mg2+/citrate symporter
MAIFFMFEKLKSNTCFFVISNFMVLIWDVFCEIKSFYLSGIEKNAVNIVKMMLFSCAYE